MTGRGDADHLSLRVSDAERDACVDALIEHHVHGRLSVEELDQRQRAALAAVTAADLRPLLADLPAAACSPRDRPPRRSPARLRDAHLTAKTATLAVAALPVFGVAWFSQWAWQYSAEGPFLGALAGGALGSAAHAVTSRFRR